MGIPLDFDANNPDQVLKEVGRMAHNVNVEIEEGKAEKEKMMRQPSHPQFLPIRPMMRYEITMHLSAKQIVKLGSYLEQLEQEEREEYEKEIEEQQKQFDPRPHPQAGRETVHLD